MAESTSIRLSKIDDLEFEALRGFEKAAILVNYLGPNAAKVLLKHGADCVEFQSRTYTVAQ